MARRARILLLAADGLPDSEIAVSLGTTRATAAQWRHRFAAEGLAGVTAIRPGRGRKPRIAEGELREMITAALQTAPPAGRAWTCRSLARLLGVSPATVSRVWRAPGAAPAGPGRVRLRQGRQALERHLWGEAYELFAAADSAETLGPDEIESLAIAAGWSGRLDECIRAWERAHALRVKEGDHRAAARAAIELSRRYWDRATPAIAGGWLRRAERHLAASQEECAENGMLANRRAYVCLRRGDAAAALEHSRAAEQVAARCGSREVRLMAMHLHGQALVRTGEIDSGFELIDEVCAAAVGGELGPDQTGLVYCWTIAVCRDVADFERCAQLTQAAALWCQENLISGFPGICRIHRAEILRTSGELAVAEAEAVAAADEMSHYSLRQAGNALNEAGLIRLRRGNLDGAEDAFVRAHELGADTQPGRSLLLLARGEAEAAFTAIAGAVARSADSMVGRAWLLPAQVGIALAAGRLDVAEQASRDLQAIAARLGRPAVSAAAAEARGAVLSAHGEMTAAGSALMEALELWLRVDSPYEAARARLLLSRVRRAVGDDDAAELELRTAYRVFGRIGAAGDARAAELELAATARAATPALTWRQLQVAELVAAGLGNNDIAQRLFISRRTAEYHVRQIMITMGFASRAQIAAWYSAGRATKKLSPGTGTPTSTRPGASRPQPALRSAQRRPHRASPAAADCL
jgi:DNA-binding CsgD family transcriptional regulator